MAQPRIALDHEETRARKLPSPWAMFLSGFLQAPRDGRVGNRVVQGAAEYDARTASIGRTPSCSSNTAPASARSARTSSTGCPPTAPISRSIPIPISSTICGIKFTDSRFIPVLGSAEDVEKIVADHGFDHADYVLSGLPFSTLPKGVAPQIAAATHRVLKPGGAFLVYQFRPKVRDVPDAALVEDRLLDRMARNPAQPQFLGVEGRGYVTLPRELLAAEIEPPRDVVVEHGHHEECRGLLDPHPRAGARLVERRA